MRVDPNNYDGDLFFDMLTANYNYSELHTKIGKRSENPVIANSSNCFCSYVRKEIGVIFFLTPNFSGNQQIIMLVILLTLILTALAWKSNN